MREIYTDRQTEWVSEIVSEKERFSECESERERGSKATLNNNYMKRCEQVEKE